MRALLQRVTRAAVSWDGGREEIGAGLLVLLGVGPADTEAIADRLAAKTAELRVFADQEGRTNLSVEEAGGAVLVVSQFTLFADTSRGRRPGFAGAAPPEVARRLYERYAGSLRDRGLLVRTGSFGAAMDVELVNHGPFTVLLDTE